MLTSKGRSVQIKLLITLFISVVSHASHANSVKACPVLPYDSSLEWTYKRGPDFDLCYAIYPDTKDMAFGIYMGGHPNFEANNSDEIEEGIVGGKAIVWYKFETDIKSPIPARQSLLTIDKEGKWFAHIWVISNTKAELKNNLAVLKKIDFKNS